MGKAEQLFKLGMMCSTGQTMPLDMLSAHKWFNIAAVLGMKDAVRPPDEIAVEMSYRLQLITSWHADMATSGIGCCRG